MKEGWTNKTLGQVCKIYNGNSINADYKKKHFLGATGGLPFIATKDVSPLGTIDYNNGVRIPNYEEYKVAPANSVFICAEGGSAGKKFAYVEKDVCFGNKLFCITPKDKSIIGKFVYHFVQSDIFRGQFFSLLTGLIGGVSAKKFQTIEIPVPSLSEQQSIVDYLDSAFAKIDAMKANAEKALNEAKALFQASLKEMLEPKEGWEEKTLEEIAQIKIGPFGSLLHKSDYILGGVPLVNPIHMVNGHIAIDNNYTISESKAKELSSYRLKENDIVFARRGEIGRCALVGKNEDTYLCGTGSLLVRFNQEVDYGFMLLLFQSKYCKEYLEKQATGATMLNINSAIVGNMTIKYPHIDIQQSIVDTLDSLKSKVDRLQENYNKISQECDALKQAILRQVFE